MLACSVWVRWGKNGVGVDGQAGPMHGGGAWVHGNAVLYYLYVWGAG